MLKGTSLALACSDDSLSYAGERLMDLLVTIEDIAVPPAVPARNLGVVLDDQICCNANITTVAQSCRIVLSNICRIWPFLTHEAAQILRETAQVQSLIITLLNYCNSLLAPNPYNTARTCIEILFTVLIKHYYYYY